MTEVYDGPWPVLVESAYGTLPSILKWTHSVIHEWNFKSEWQARENARGLASEMAQDGLLTSLSVFPSGTVPAKRKKSCKFATFAFDQPDEVNCVSPAVNVPGIVQYKPDPAAGARVPDPPGPPQEHSNHHGHHAHGRTFLNRPYWQQQVWQRLQEEGVEDDADEGPVFFMNSYFICHATHRHQHTGKRDEVYLGRLADPALPLLVYLVTPEPPFSIQPGTVGTLLLIQNPHPFRAACLVTVVEPALPRLRVTEIAHSFDIVVPFRHILFHAGVASPM